MKLKNKSLLAFFLILMVVPALGQDFDKMQQAFSNSYTFESQKEFSKAIQELMDVYQEDSYETNLRLGWLYYNAGTHIESASYYKKCVELKPYSVEARFGYTYPLATLGNWSLVKTQYYKILEIDPMNTHANYQLGLMFYNAEDYGAALKHFEKVVNQYPFDYDGTIMFAWTHYQLGKLREAEVLFKKALLIRPDDDAALEGLGLVK